MPSIQKSLLWILTTVVVVGAVLRRRLDGTQNADVVKFTQARVSVESILSLIFRRYQLDERHGKSFFNSASNIDERGWNIIKWQLATKILASLTGDGTRSTYLMVFGGSSVTAGHDSYYNQSYPAIVNKRLAPVFEQIGIRLQVNNIAMGANACVPYILCYESQGGADADFVGWEQSYNCGHDDYIFEMAMRHAGWKQHPGVVYYSASGAFSPNKCPPSEDAVPYCSEDWTPSDAGLEPWVATPEAVKEQKHLQFKFSAGGSSSMRFSGGFRFDYPSVAALGFNVWEKNRECVHLRKGTDIIEQGCSAVDAVEECGMKFMTKEASVYGQEGGKGANWHPTRAFHMLRGEEIVWLYGLVLHEVLTQLLQDLKDGKTLASIGSDYASQLRAFQQPLPNPKKCTSNLHCDARPSCFTDFQPHHTTKTRLQDLVVGETTWVYDPCEDGDWAKKYGYQDRKPTYRSQKQDELHLQIRIEDAHRDHLWLCGLAKEALANARYEVHYNVEFTDDADRKTYRPPEKTPRASWTKHRSVGFECVELQGLPVGKHVLSVRSAADDKVVELTHVIMW